MSSGSTPSPAVRVDSRVAAALDNNRPVVALESTVYSTLGLPHPLNAEILRSTIDDLSAMQVTPALTAVIDGVACAGVSELDHPRILAARDKVSARDLALAVAQKWPVGVTTVGASLTLANQAGISVFATGGIGGVHRNYGETGDASGDLPMIAAHPLVTVCAGAKAFLDLPRTLERLETLGVPVIGYRTDRFPAFTALDSGLAVPHRSDDPAEIAAILAARRSLGQGGVLVCVPPPDPIDQATLDLANAQAEAAADEAAVRGADRTPFILAQIAEFTNGASVTANLALVRNNARVAGEIATAVADTAA